jgi:hypothetical protein
VAAHVKVARSRARSVVGADATDAARTTNVASPDAPRAEFVSPSTNSMSAPARGTGLSCTATSDSPPTTMAYAPYAVGPMVPANATTSAVTVARATSGRSDGNAIGANASSTDTTVVATNEPRRTVDAVSVAAYETARPLTRAPETA